MNLVKKNGLRVFDIKQNQINGSSKQYFICHGNSKIKSKNKTLNNVLADESKLKLNKVDTYRTFIKQINSLKQRLKKFVDVIKKKKKIIHCYGASTNGNVLLQYFQLDNKKIRFAAERNKNKYGLVTPGTRIKIISEKLSRSLRPDYYLVLPWHFKDEILKRERDIIKNGTKFIFPLPKYEIVNKS